jgi:hypothetical protein
MGLVLGVVFVALAIRQVDWSNTFDTLRLVDVPMVVLGTVLLLGTVVLFSVRWRALLLTSGKLNVTDTFSYLMIGNLTNTVLPFRLGDVVRAALIGRQHNIGIGPAFGSVVLERMLDILLVMVLLLVLSLAIDIPPVVRFGMILVAGGTLGLLAVVIGLTFSEHRLPDLVWRLTSLAPQAISQRIITWAMPFVSGLQVLRDRRQLGMALAISVLAWGVAGAGTMFWIKAFHLDAPWYSAFFVLAVVNIGAAIPSSPGAIGIYHYLAILALSVWVTDQSALLGYAIGTHGLILTVNILVGGACLIWRGLTLASIKTMAPAATQQLKDESRT